MNITSKSKLTNIRVASTNDSTLGILYIDNVPQGFVIEDEHREVKVKGETRIPAGAYKLGIRKDITPMTQKYRDKYYWFDKHIELLDVPNFTGVYIHIGNFENNTEGCQIIGFDASTSRGEFRNKQSTLMFKMLYEKLYPLLENGANIYYEIIDRDNL